MMGDGSHGSDVDALLRYCVQYGLAKAARRITLQESKSLPIRS
jgi:hypothetical protein